METTKTNEIEKIIKAKIKEELERANAELTYEAERLLNQGIQRINNVYGSAIKTLEQLELTDATIFDFFQKTNGNIRVHEIEVNYPGTLGIELPNGQRIDQRNINERNPIYLEKAKYKIILMAIEVGEKSG